MKTSRRRFLAASGGIAVAGALSRRAFASTERSTRIVHVSVQVAKGKRLTPVAPNAYAPYRGFDVREPVLRIRTSDGLEGIGRQGAKPEVLMRLIGVNPFELFDWDSDRIRGAKPGHAELLAELGSCDVALLDLLGKAIKRPIADLLGTRLRDWTDVYDSSLYMEDLLKPQERENLAYLAEGKIPDDPAQLVALKAKWVLQQPGGVRILKIKLGRVKWMGDMQKAVERDIAVVHAIRKAVGPNVVLFVDGNDGYTKQPLAAADFALATKDAGVYAMEEMFPETKENELREVKSRLRAAGVLTKLADGENARDGIPQAICEKRFTTSDGRTEPLFDIDQPDMNDNGYLRMAHIAQRVSPLGMTVAPHNFGSKLGFWSMIHSGLVTPNWEFCEKDDSEFPALKPEGFVFEFGKAKLAGMPGIGLVLDDSKLEKPTVSMDA